MRRCLSFLTRCFNSDDLLQEVDEGHGRSEGESRPLLATPNTQEQPSVAMTSRPPSPPALGKNISIPTLNGSSVIPVVARALAPLEDVLQKWCEVHKLADYDTTIILKKNKYFGVSCKPKLNLIQPSSPRKGFELTSATYTEEGIKQLDLKAQDVGIITISLKKGVGLFLP